MDRPKVGEIVNASTIGFMEQTAEIPIATTVSALRRYHDSRMRRLRRIATFYLAIGCLVLSCTLGIGVLEAFGANIIYDPASRGKRADVSDWSIFPLRSMAAERYEVATTTSNMRLRSGVDVTRPSVDVPHGMENATATDAIRLDATQLTHTAASSFIPNPPPVARIAVPSIGVDADVVVHGIQAGGEMQSPGDPWTVAWYDFSSHPLHPGNAVFAGHVDYVDIGPAVFWRLRELVEGAEILIVLTDGRALTYRVTAMTTVASDTDVATLPQIVGHTQMPSLTLITCAGSFDSDAMQYTERLIVRAERT